MIWIYFSPQAKKMLCWILYLINQFIEHQKTGEFTDLIRIWRLEFKHCCKVKPLSPKTVGFKEKRVFPIKPEATLLLLSAEALPVGHNPTNLRFTREGQQHKDLREIPTSKQVREWTSWERNRKYLCGLSKP